MSPRDAAAILSTGEGPEKDLFGIQGYFMPISEVERKKDGFMISKTKRVGPIEMDQKRS